MGFLAGKRILITGLISNRSIAYGIAKACHREGAELAFTYQNERFKDRMAKYADEFGSTAIYPCDVSQAAEIEVARTIGATDAFSRRPFYYFGALQGALGGLLAAALVIGALRLLAGPVGDLAALYGSTFSLRAPGVIEVVVLSSAGALLGWLGAQLSVSLSLRKFD